ncbi:hypothetical protein [Thermococcus celer]|uniref:Uncharacterized protein n=1 Tax=Thermococcus celer Vu 13 = JCM 8558 TaxID=1293037 RepID=A0A218P3A1_THECE|nr:hypothetical protein [Thermococcus celer]ASI99404.1 hypothetical protein A3L02_07470 [Thermococcus celer Vu 13 = JCM 8558]
MWKKLFGIGLLALGLFGLVFGAVAAYQGEPGPNPEINREMMPAQAMEMKGYGHHGERGKPQFMGLGAMGQNLEEVSIEEISEKAEEILSQVTIEEFTNPRGLTIQRLVYDGQYIGKVVGDYNLSELSIYKAFETQMGIKVFLGYEGQIVGFFLIK